MPTVSVIVPNYNHSRFLQRRIDSLLRQTFQDFELILLEDCSTDDSRSILSLYAKDPRVRIEFNEANSGITFREWNKGVRLARGKYVWIAESDDYADVHLLEKLVAVLDEEPTVTFVYCQSWRLNGLVVPSGSVDAVADAISCLVTHPHECTQMSRMARARACEMFDIEKSMAEIERLVLSANFS